MYYVYKNLEKNGAIYFSKSFSANKMNWESKRERMQQTDIKTSHQYPKQVIPDPQINFLSIPAATSLRKPTRTS